MQQRHLLARSDCARVWGTLEAEPQDLGGHAVVERCADAIREDDVRQQPHQVTRFCDAQGLLVCRICHGDGGLTIEVLRRCVRRYSLPLPFI